MARFSAESFRAAAPGLGVLAQAIGGGGNQAFEAARQNEIGFQTKIAQALAHTSALNAKADQDRQETGVMSGRADVGDELIANASNTDVPTVRAYRQQLQTGVRPTSSATGDPETDAAIGMAGAPAIQTSIAQAIAKAMPQYAPYRTNTKDMKPDDLAQARAIDRQAGLSDDVITGKLNRNTVGGAQAAAAGKDLYNRDSTGSVLDQFTGALDESGGLAKGTIALRGAQAGQANASAANSYASAGQHKAQTEKIRTETGQIINAPKGQFDPQSGMLIDTRNGTARPVIGADGQPLAPRVKELNEGQAKDNGYGSRMQEADGILKRMAGKYSPAGVNARVAADNSVIPGAGMVANWLQSEEGQQVEQAQRDFINAILRRESGAAIAPSEFANATKQYFPQPNDKPENLKQKARNRQIAIEGVFGSVPAARRGVPSLTRPGPAAEPGVITVDY